MTEKKSYTREELMAMDPHEREALLRSFAPATAARGAAPAREPAPKPHMEVRVEQLVGRAQTSEGVKWYRQPVDRVFINGEHLATIGRFADAPLNFLTGGISEADQLEVLRQVTEIRKNDPNPKVQAMVPRQTLVPIIPAADELERVFDDLDATRDVQDAEELPAEEMNEVPDEEREPQ